MTTRTGIAPATPPVGATSIATRTLRFLPLAWLVLLSLAAGPVPASGGDWPQWCGRDDRNMASDEKGLPDHFEGGRGGTEDGNGLRNVKWVARLGDRSFVFGSPVVAAGKVFIGGGIEKNDKKDARLWCFRESDGALLWQMRSPFWPKRVNRSFGICSTPTVDGDRVYLLDHMGNVLCLDANGLAGRPASPEDLEMIATDRQCKQFDLAPDGRRLLEWTAGEPGVAAANDAHLLWRFDMEREVNCWPFNAQSAAIIVHGDFLYVATCSVLSGYEEAGSKYWIDEWKKKFGQSTYDSPSLIVLDKRTGKLLARDREGIFERTFHGAHASPALGTVNGKELLFYGGGDGTCYAFDPAFEAGADGKPGTLKLVWKFDCLSPATYGPDYTGQRLKQAEVMASPVVYNNRIYVSVGNDLTRSGSEAGPGRLLCLDAAKTGDITATGKIWSFDTIRSTSSTVAIADGLLYTADARGYVYCLDADSGKLHWRAGDPNEKYVGSMVWSSPLLAGDKVFVTAKTKGLAVFAAGKDKKFLGLSRAYGDMAASPAAANGVLYVATDKYLYALEEGKSCRPQTPLTPDSAKDKEPKADRRPWPRWPAVVTLAAAVAVAAFAAAWAIRRAKKRKAA